MGGEEWSIKEVEVGSSGEFRWRWGGVENREGGGGQEWRIEEVEVGKSGEWRRWRWGGVENRGGGGLDEWGMEDEGRREGK